jgi:osmotically inducible protein OsmC
MPTRHAGAAWEGGLKGGKGTFSGESGGIGGAYSFDSRFAEGKGSSPEELLAAAEAACYSMALSGGLERNGTIATRIDTQAACTVERQPEGGFRITGIKLTVRASVPGIDDATFQNIAANTKETCPVSKALAGNLAISIEAALT